MCTPQEDNRIASSSVDNSANLYRLEFFTVLGGERVLGEVESTKPHQWFAPK